MTTAAMAMVAMKILILRSNRVAAGSATLGYDGRGNLNASGSTAYAYTT
jgi:hypothetical protein